MATPHPFASTTTISPTQPLGDHTIQPDAITGVFDHNYFRFYRTKRTNFLSNLRINGPDGESNATWTVPENFGTSQFLFIENNYFPESELLYSIAILAGE